MSLKEALIKMKEDTNRKHPKLREQFHSYVAKKKKYDAMKSNISHKQGEQRNQIVQGTRFQ